MGIPYDSKKESLSSHINYKPILPEQNESPISFALRAAAHLISPSQVSGESNEIECVDVAKQILGLKDELEQKWRAFIGSPKL